MNKYITKTQVIYQEPGIRFEIVAISIGDCECKIFRELLYDSHSITLNEYTEEPIWWNRQIKIDRVLTYHQKYYLKNKEKMKLYQKEWFKKNRDKWNEYQKNKKKKKM